MPPVSNLGQLRYQLLHRYNGDDNTYVVGLLEELNKNDVHILPGTVSDS